MLTVKHDFVKIVLLSLDYFNEYNRLHYKRSIQSRFFLFPIQNLNDYSNRGIRGRRLLCRTPSSLPAPHRSNPQRPASSGCWGRRNSASIWRTSGRTRCTGSLPANRSVAVLFGNNNCYYDYVIIMVTIISVNIN